jgi:hypothetical protein
LTFWEIIGFKLFFVWENRILEHIPICQIDFLNFNILFGWIGVNPIFELWYINNISLEEVVELTKMVRNFSRLP